jgi:S-methyl-5-thioribose-1-phosphate isomerase
VYKAGKKSVGDAVKEALLIADEDARDSRLIGQFGMALIANNTRILTHCNAGWLAFVNYGTALSPIYMAHQNGINVFVYVDETRPRGQGARLTAWELKNENIDHRIIPDNAAAYFMEKGEVDMVIVGADRIAGNGDTANKIGTLEKAIIAKEFSIPFYVAAPTSTFDLECKHGDEIEIENRSEEEVLFQTGLDNNGNLNKFLVCSPGSEALNPAFDITPKKYITGFITEKGIINPYTQSIKRICKEKNT